MSDGRILVGDHDGVYVLRFTGDVRLNLSATMDALLRGIVARDDFNAILVDLSRAENIDSTSLGLLAKLSIETRRRHGIVPTLVSTNPDITRILATMGFEDIFHVVETPLLEPEQLGELPKVAVDEDELRERVLEAHRTLMRLNEQNREAFRDLVTALEAEPVVGAT